MPPDNELKALTVDQAEMLAARDTDLYLDGLTALSDEAAEALGQHDGGLLSLNGLTALSDNAAKSLAQHKRHLHLRGLTTLSPTAARTLFRNQHILLPDKFGGDLR